MEIAEIYRNIHLIFASLTNQFYMKTKYIVLGILSIILIFSGCHGCRVYSVLVDKDENVNSGWSQVQNVYQRRADLAQEIVDVVSRSANFEKSTLTEVIQARQQVTNIKVDPSNPESFKQFDQAQSGLASALSRLMVVIERYPELKTTDQFAKFQDQMEGSENRIATERMEYTNRVQDYNKYRRKPVFPVLTASVFGFEAKPYFEASQKAQSAPDINSRFKENDEAIKSVNQ